jgi:hypothetical protein
MGPPLLRSQGWGAQQFTQRPRSANATNTVKHVTLMEAPPLLLSVAAIQERTGLGATFIKNEIRTGRMVGRKAGDRTVVAVEEFERWVGSLRPVNGGGSEALGDAVERATRLSDRR